MSKLVLKLIKKKLKKNVLTRLNLGDFTLFMGNLENIAEEKTFLNIL
jgi:hypothetical protein